MIDVVEKYGEKTVNVSVSNNAAGTTKFSIRTTNGTGNATFEDGSSEVIVNGNTTNQPLKIKGVTESSAADNITIEAKLNNSSTVSASDEFTVAVITSLEFERINTTGTSPDVPFDENPGIDGVPNPDRSEGQRIYPDKNVPMDGTDRSIIRVKASVSPPVPGVKVYFASFDLDDPSASGLPIDTTGNNGNDNNGAVNVSKSGEFIAPDPNNCTAVTTANDVSKIGCNVIGEAAVTNYKVTMQPGDNFAVAASFSDIYRNGIALNTTDGSIIQNSASQPIPVSGGTNLNNVAGLRTRMLTVWRKLHIEVDSMGNVGSGNNVSGTVVTNGRKIPPGVFNIEVNPSNPPLELQRFANGRVVIGGRSYSVIQNAYSPSGSDVLQIRVLTSVTIANGAAFTLYDDDDYNADDGGSPDGDYNEPIARLPDSFKYLSAEDGNYPDGRPRNLYASVYIMPEYNWAENVAHYNQTNLQFELNVEDGNNNATLINVLNRNRDSNNDERDDFWIAYLLIGYQGPLLADFDGLNPSGTASEDARLGVGANQFIIGTEIPNCDCYNSIVCPSGGVACTLPSGALKLPRGALGSLIFQEVIQDVKRYFIAPPSPVTPRTIEEIKLTIPHELGHQFGLLGDQSRATFKIMDYSNYVGNVVNDEAFHPEHINIMRRRVNSPGN